MINSKFLRNNRGFTLIEVLLSLTILGFVLTGTMTFFSQAYSYTHMNENKTVGINVARNVLYYMEQQDYEIIKKGFLTDKAKETEKAGETVDTGDSGDTEQNGIPLTIANCDDLYNPNPSVADSELKPIFDQNVCKGFFSTTINNVDFETKVLIKKHDLEEFLIHVFVTVTWGDQTASVEGLIKNERMPK